VAGSKGSTTFLWVLVVLLVTANAGEVVITSGRSHTNGGDIEGKMMIEAKTALELALDAAAPRVDRRRVANILVDPGETSYVVHLAMIAPAGEIMTDEFVIDVDGNSGVASNLRAVSSQNPVRDLAEDLREAMIISGVEAHQAALAAIKGYEHYDRFGRLEVRLHSDHYRVTFPDPASRSSDARGADYSYQVWVAATTGEVTRILAAS
jgi:hypothetical protein